MSVKNDLSFVLYYHDKSWFEFSEMSRPVANGTPFVLNFRKRRQPREAYTKTFKNMVQRICFFPGISGLYRAACFAFRKFN